MLKHEDTSRAQPSPAAQVRVTPEELAAAITRLEAKKDAGQRTLEGTVAIGEVVQQLGLDATPEELLAEVQVGRQETGLPKTAPQKRRPSLGYRLVLALGLSSIVLPLVGLGVGLSNNAHPDYSARHLQIDQNQLVVGDASGRQLFASEVSDNQIFHCRLGGEYLTASNYQSNDTQPAWTLIKHGGKIYIRGWMPRVSNKVLQAEGVFITNGRSPQNLVAVTLPLDGFMVIPVTSGAEDETENIYAIDIHFDKHAYERW